MTGHELDADGNCIDCEVAAQVIGRRNDELEAENAKLRAVVRAVRAWRARHPRSKDECALWIDEAIHHLDALPPSDVEGTP